MPVVMKQPESDNKLLRAARKFVSEGSEGAAMDLVSPMGVGGVVAKKAAPKVVEKATETIERWAPKAKELIESVSKKFLTESNPLKMTQASVPSYVKLKNGITIHAVQNQKNKDIFLLAKKGSKYFDDVTEAFRGSEPWDAEPAWGVEALDEFIQRVSKAK